MKRTASPTDHTLTTGRRTAGLREDYDTRAMNSPGAAIFNRAARTAGTKNQLTRYSSVVAGFRCSDTIKKPGTAPQQSPAGRCEGTERSVPGVTHDAPERQYDIADTVQPGGPAWPALSGE